MKHPLQTKDWAEFRRKTGVKVIETKDFILTLHPFPFTNYTIGYLPKGNFPTKAAIEDLKRIGRVENAIFIQLEPNVEGNKELEEKIINLGLVKSAHPLFTQYTFVLDITPSEEELLKSMSQKTRYNIRLAEKKGVKVIEDNSNKAFEDYLKLLEETTKRQGFYAHTPLYHKLMWETLKTRNSELSAHLLKADYNGSTLVSWILFVCGDTLYYPYGASSTKFREVMASNLIMWEAIRLGKKLGLKKFDMWGSLGENPDLNDPWYGFHKFKQGYGAKLVKFVGSYDLVINPLFYNGYKIADKLRYILLKLK
jgi:lipid II:glycine glycyltransferase (peptidoglycan interpeptide bridge formation enzyme)